MDHFFAIVLFPNSELLRFLRNLKLSLPFSGNLLDMSCRYIPSLIRNAPRLKTRGIEILRDPRTNKGSSYTLHERQLLGIHGLLPPNPQNQDVEEQRVISNLYQLDDNLSRYMMLMSLQDLNEKLFYRTIRTHLEYCLPLIYTPTVGLACLNFGFVFRRPRGHIFTLLKNWPADTIKTVVMTDGERILGFGDMGANGMAIPLSKAVLYTALGGLQPYHCLPVMLDVGTNNEKLLEASIGIARLLVQAIMEEGFSEDEAKSRIFIMDSKGLIVTSHELSAAKSEFARSDYPKVDSLLEAIRLIRPSVLIGASGQSGAFTRDILRELSTIHKTPIIFVLSNQSNLGECTSQMAYKATEWRCIFVSGSSSEPVRTPDDRLLKPSQGNNCYVFPSLVNALSLAVIRPLTYKLLLTAAKKLSELVTDDDIRQGSMYPSIARLPTITKEVSCAIMEQAYKDKIAFFTPEPYNKMEFIESYYYDHRYINFTPDQYVW
ncbi:malate dehydrogenase (oxaloacetate-decarboxylating)(NADP+) [Schistosoma bovis]|uniref:Malate dehydrogenase (Oxaloacetate-decarboxylating)(NADP+) n=2 Tax=Schistosoma bovis TaxID=6184 RepID=A0A430Q684_SCHBO|nr:malate dehydrogenase (oxaloacetate-decarboxylating)(NADP+) [Schistosoma bovis]